MLTTSLRDRVPVFALGFAGMIALSGFAPVAYSQREIAAPPAIKVLRTNVYWAQGGAGGVNTVYIVGDNGVIVFDLSEFPSTARDLLSELAKITPKPVTHVIVSHTNPDHFKGIFAFPRGLTIIAQEETAARIESILHYQRDAERVHFLPTNTVRDRADVRIHGVNMRLLHWAPAHTSGDLVAYLPDHKIALIGDLGGGTGVHLEDYGSTEGAIESLKQIVALDADVFLGGHGDLMTKAQLQKSLADVTARRAKVVQLFKEGKSLAEAEKEMGEVLPPPPPPGAPQSLRQMFARPRPEIPGLQVFRPFRGMSYTEMVYTELGRERRR
jgi:cyclase